MSNKLQQKVKGSTAGILACCHDKDQNTQIFSPINIQLMEHESFKNKHCANHKTLSQRVVLALAPRYRTLRHKGSGRFMPLERNARAHK